MAEKCPICRGTGFEIGVREDGVTSSSPCACRQEARGERLRRGARIPRRYDHCSFDTFGFQEPGDPSLKAAHDVARRWLEAWPAVEHGLLFHGTPGTGKTHLAVAIARELIQSKNTGVLFYEHRELLKTLQGTFDAAASQRESDVLRPVLEAEVLILDDLGAGRITAWNKDVLHDVIVSRYNAMRPLVITTNHVIDAGPKKSANRRDPPLDAPLTLKDRLGDALMSRLYEMCEIVPMRGKDFRVMVNQHSRYV